MTVRGTAESIRGLLEGNTNLLHFERWQSKRNAAVRSILRDFPWLWAILGYWSPDQAEYVKVSQDMTNLKAALSQSSTKTRFKAWTVTTTADDEIFDLQIKSIKQNDDCTWAEAIMKETFRHVYIDYIVVVDPFWGEDHCCKRITIFRHPEKLPLNGTVDDVVQFCGSGAQWPIA